MSEIPNPEHFEHPPVKIDLFSPEITAAFAEATIFAKTEQALVRPAVPGEVITSIPSGNHEQTSRIAKENEVVLTYASNGEQVIQEASVFASRWEPTEEEGIFRAKGLSRIIPNPTGQDFITETDWGVQENKADYLLACVYDPENPDVISSDRYAIAREVFERTFAPAEQVYGHVPGQEAA